jgi:16S rRNA (cytosine967-C5)-methyltransferase
MQPAARVQAAIELLDLIIVAARENGAAADVIIANWFRTRRYAGSKDRRAVRELVYRAIRSFGAPPENGRTAILSLGDLDDYFDGSPHGPAIIGQAEQRQTPSLLPEWLADLIPVEEHAALLERAPLDIRVNALRSHRDAILAQLPDAEPIAGTDFGLRLAENTPLAANPALDGLIEVQDAGSQFIANACDAKPGQTVIDLCAGAGGKTLALAAMMNGQGRLIASDTDRGRLSRLPSRAEKAGVTNLETLLLNPNRELDALSSLSGAADIVLVDAPCSGTGTWRRNPELRWRLTQKRLDQVGALQAYILDIAAHLVKPGGSLIYAVCSLLEQEGCEQVTDFLKRHDGWKSSKIQCPVGREAGHGILLTPNHDKTDGFFFAKVEKL